MKPSTCFHCGLENPKPERFHGEVLGDPRSFCCAGCLAIAETLEKNNLTDFYRFRDKPSSKPFELIPQELFELNALDNSEILDEISSKNKNTRRIELGIEGITCAACGWLIEQSLSTVLQVKSINVNVTTHRAILTWDEDKPLSDILKTLLKLGYRGYPFSEDSREKAFEKTNQKYIKRLLVAALGMMQVMTYALAIYIGEFQDLEKEHQLFLHWISGLITTPVVFYSAKPFFTSAFNNLKAKQLGMNLPVSIAILSAYTASIYSLISNSHVYYFDSVVMFTFFLLIGRFLEHRARYHSMLKQQSFSQLLPLSVSKRNPDLSISVLSISQVVPGDILIINAGMVIPLDGILCERSAEINEAVLTGEFSPVCKNIGDTLLSGSTNNSASLVMKVTKEKNKSHLQKLIELQQDAEQLKPDSVTMADKISHWYVSILLLIVVGTALFYWHHSPEQMFEIILSILVVSCPCALSLATPAAITAATSHLSSLGLMLRTQSALSKLAKIENVFFDKTGTLTTGEMQRVAVNTYQDLTQEQCLEASYLLESCSNHPVSRAFVRTEGGLTMLASNLKEEIGLGVSGTIDGIAFCLGNQQLLDSYSIKNCDKTYNQSGTKLYLARRKQHIATFTLQDKLKPSAAIAVNELHRNKYLVSILSGDSSNVVKEVADELSIKKFYAESYPKKKLAIINDSQKNFKHSLMVGDGFNDVGALAAASVSITMGTGTNLSKTASDAVLVSNDLTIIPKALQLSKKVESVIFQNLAWAITYNLFAIPFAVMGLVPAWLAALGMSLSSLVVVLNALRLRKGI